MAYYRTAAKILPKGLERVLDIEKTKRHQKAEISADWVCQDLGNTEDGGQKIEDVACDVPGSEAGDCIIPQIMSLRLVFVG